MKPNIRKVVWESEREIIVSRPQEKPNPIYIVGAILAHSDIAGMIFNLKLSQRVRYLRSVALDATYIKCVMEY